MVMNEAASAPVVSASTSRETPTPLENGVGVLPVARGDEAGTGRAVVGGVIPAAHLLEAKHELAELLLRASKGVDVALSAVDGAPPLRSERRGGGDNGFDGVVGGVEGGVVAGGVVGRCVFTNVDTDRTG
jgi:hypothetical protein